MDWTPPLLEELPLKEIPLRGSVGQLLGNRTMAKDGIALKKKLKIKIKLNPCPSCLLSLLAFVPGSQ